MSVRLFLFHKNTIHILILGEIVGGEDRIDTKLFSKAGNNLITNFGKEEWRDVHFTFYDAPGGPLI